MKENTATQKTRTAPIRRAAVDLEVEVKLRCENVDRLLSSGLAVKLVEDRHLEDNYVYQLPDGNLRKGQYLRIRHTGDGEGSGRRRSGVLTYKGKHKRQASVGGKQKGKKVREEIETSVGQPPKLIKILKRLGLRRSFRYQKYRTIYRVTLADRRALLAMFDETPLGNFLELEGDGGVINSVAEALGYSPKEFVAESYVELHVAKCSTRGEPMSDMLLDETRERQEKKRARRKQRAAKAGKESAASSPATERRSEAVAKGRKRQARKGKASKQKGKSASPKRARTPSPKKASRATDESPAPVARRGNGSAGPSVLDGKRVTNPRARARLALAVDTTRGAGH